MRMEKAMISSRLGDKVTALPRSGSRVRAPSPAPRFPKTAKLTKARCTSGLFVFGEIFFVAWLFLALRKNRLEKNDLKKFLLNWFGREGPARHTLLTRSGCDSIWPSDPPQSRPKLRPPKTLK